MREIHKLSINLSKILFWLFMLAILAGFAVMGVISHYSKGLPSSEQLKSYNPKKMTMLYDAKGHLIAEYATEKRIYMPIDKVPAMVKNAFLAAEDQNFYRHSGIDLLSILRAIVHNANSRITGSGSVSGGSTITQQVIKNLVLSKEKTFDRKIKEAILAVRITKELPKDKILEIYLNEIFLGNRSYGVGAAAANYFGKTLDELSVEEAATLAALPKAPSEYDPRRNPKRATERRNWVIDRMVAEGYITDNQGEIAKKHEIKIAESSGDEITTMHFAEEVRRQLLTRFGEEKLYTGGLFVRTTMEPELQKLLEKSFFKALIDYDRARGWRGAINKIGDVDIWKELLSEVKEPENIGPWQLAVVLETKGDRLVIGLKDGSESYVPTEKLKWAKPSPSAVAKAKDVIVVSKIEEKDKTYYELQQIPEVNGAAILIDPHTGRVLAMVGGYIYGTSEFNRATQAKRQPGSAFKPFVYLAGLESGFKPTTVINDGPIYIPQGPGLPVWAPKNYSNDYLGPVPMRVGLEKSRNNMTVQLARMIGIKKVQEVAKRFGIFDDPIPYYPMVLGAQETTLVRLATAYAALANGGKKVETKLIDRVQDADGKILYTSENRVCKNCSIDASDVIPSLSDESPQISDPTANYLLTQMLQGVVQRGTATRAAKFGVPMAGKTGTTNDSLDTWFMGFTPDIVFGAYVGYDKPRTLGAKATGSSVALPIYMNFMEEYLKTHTEKKPFKTPDGLMMMKIDVSTGQAPNEFSDPANIRYEVVNPQSPQINYDPDFLKDTQGTAESPLHDPNQDQNNTPDHSDDSPSGIY